jgi:CO/xanthine dehydrogenase Mo-binding subunit
MVDANLSLAISAGDGVTALSRRGLLKAGGAMIVGVSLPQTTPAAAQGARGGKAGPPEYQAVDTWIAIHRDNTATIYTGKCELGQGNQTGLLQVAAEELDLGMHQVSTVRLDTNITPDQQATSSSSSIHRGAPALRAAAAQARMSLLARAATRLGVQVGSLQVRDGIVSVRGENGFRSVTYGELLGDKPFNVKYDGSAPVKSPGQYRLVGKSPARIDIPEKAAGRYVHVQHQRLPGMLHGRVVLPHGQRGFGIGAKPLSVDEASIAHIRGARVIRRGDFLGVVAEREWDAVKAARDLVVTWQGGAPLGTHNSVHERMRKDKTIDTIVANQGDPSAMMQKATFVRGSSYFCPYQSHAPFAPNCALADPTGEQLVIKSSTQDVYSSRKQVADILGLPIEKIRLQYFEGSGTFGRSCYEDATQAAAIMATATGRPVRVQYMRWDEHGWDNFGPAHLAEVRAGVDAEGNIIAYEYDGWQHGWTMTSTVSDSARTKPGAERASGSGSIIVNPISTGSMYKIQNRRVTSHAVPMVNYLRGAALRSPLDLSFAFASEQTIDELAAALRMDPVEFRRRNIGDERWLGVLDAAVHAAAWQPRVMGSHIAAGDLLSGVGVALGTHHVSYGAAVAEIQVNRTTGIIIAKRLFGAMDCGLAVNPALVENQMVGQMVQATGRVLKEEVTFDDQGVTSLDWNGYQVLRFAEHPDVVPVVVQRVDEPSTGAGEEVMGATAAAIANAFFDATGVRLRQFPMTPERVLTALGRQRA